MSIVEEGGVLAGGARAANEAGYNFIVSAVLWCAVQCRGLTLG